MKYSVVDSGPDPHGSSLIWLSWIRIRIGNADPYLGARKLTKINKETWIPAFKRAFAPITYIKYNFCVKIKLFVTAKSDQDPDPHWFGSLEPDAHCLNC